MFLVPDSPMGDLSKEPNFGTHYNEQLCLLLNIFIMLSHFLGFPKLYFGKRINSAKADIFFVVELESLNYATDPLRIE